jgi:hypothetical protein
MRMAKDIATCPFDTGQDTLTSQKVHVAHHLGDRTVQRARLQYFAPENDIEVRKVLRKAARKNCIASGCDTWFLAQPQREALEAGQRAARGDFVHEIPGPEATHALPPGRKSARRQPRREAKGANQGRRADPRE